MLDFGVSVTCVMRVLYSHFLVIWRVWGCVLSSSYAASDVYRGHETQRHRDTETQRHRETETQRHRDTETQRHRDT